MSNSGVRPHKEICYRTIKISFLFSLSIEVCQIILRVGTFQISDLVTNTAGGLIGGIIYWRNIGVRPHKEKINISKEIINKTRGAAAPYAAQIFTHLSVVSSRQRFYDWL